MAEFSKINFDFLIVGGGTAGLVLAARLSEDPGVQVGVIEAGRSRLGDPSVDLPAGVGMMLSNPEYDWVYQTIPQNASHCRTFNVPRGKMLGGSSGINFMAYGRPCARDLDDWAERLGLDDWSWSGLRKYFLRSESLQINPEGKLGNNVYDGFPNCDPSLHGHDGPIHTSMGPWHVPIEKDLLAALDQTSGIDRPAEPYGGSHLGFYRSLLTIDRSARPVRSYSASGYLAPALDRPNLAVLTDAVALKILFKGGSRDGREVEGTSVPIAQGVQFQYQGAKYAVFANETILAAGSIKTPQLLELSGVGDPEILEAASVPCLVQNKDVGINLQEKTMSAVVYELAPGADCLSLDSMFMEPTLVEEHRRFYAESGTGAFSGAVNLTGFIPYASQVSPQRLDETLSSILSPPVQHDGQDFDFQRRQRQAIHDRIKSPLSADIQVMGSPANFNIRRGRENCAKLLAGPPAGYGPCYSLVVSNMYPASRGSVHITSPDPHAPPRIDPGFLSHPADVDLLAAGVAFADRVFQSPALQDRVARRVDPPPDVDLQDRNQARDFVRDRIITYHHALGTCAMGRVVDERLLVKGVAGLRVVDAGVLPMQVSTAILATVYAMAEKAADIIKEDHGMYMG